MTKTIDSLKRHPFKEDVLHSHIADTYFRQRSRHKTRHKKSFPILDVLKTFQKIAFATLFILSVAALVVTAISFYNQQRLEFIKRSTVSSKVVDIIEGGIFNRDIIRRISFGGQAKNRQSNLGQDRITVSNPKKYKWADLSIDFRFPLDLSERRLKMSLKGKTGGEKVNLVLRDTRSKSFKINSLSLSSDWRETGIDLSDASRQIDLSSINHMRIESAYAGESVSDLEKPLNMTFYIKNIDAVLKEG